jgi:hypothetical protein
MRYTRLKRQIEDGTLIGTHGVAFSPAKIKKPITPKNKTASQKVQAKSYGGAGKRNHDLISNDDDDEEEIGKCKKSDALDKVKEETLMKEEDLKDEDVKREDLDSSLSSLPSFSYDDEDLPTKIRKNSSFKHSIAFPICHQSPTSIVLPKSEPQPLFQSMTSWAEHYPVTSMARIGGSRLSGDGKRYHSSRPSFAGGRGGVAPPFKSASPKASLNSFGRH